MIKDSANIRDSYSLYKANIETPIDIRTYIEIVNGFIKFLMDKVLEGWDIRLPAKLGVIGIRGKKVKPKVDKDGKIKGLAPNWGETRKLWAKDEKAKENKTILYCFNEHTNGVRYNIEWIKKTALFKNKSVYSLRFSRGNKRTTSAKIYNGAEYLEKHIDYGNK
jgi:hypothetical protein